MTETPTAPSPGREGPAKKPWHQRWWAWAAGGLALLIVISALAGEGEQTSTSDTSDESAESLETTSDARSTKTDRAPVVPVRLANVEASTVRKASVTIHGSAPTSAKVRINGRRPARQGRRFSLTGALREGENEFRVTAYAPGHERFDRTISVTRKLTAAERAALRERAKQRFVASARPIPYNQLEKSPDRHSGKRVCYRGKIFQIQEAGSAGGIMLLSVTDMGYDIWSDNVWVDYDHSIRSAEDDLVTVCGTITGSKSYETQIGGRTYVPQMHARYITE